MKLRKAAAAFAAIAVAMAALAGCASGAATQTGTTQTGTITGHFQMEGGPVSPGSLSGVTPSHALSGTVTATSGSVTQHASVGQDGAFTLVLPVGTYTLSGTSPDMNNGQDSCAATSPVTVVKGGTAHADVTCLVP
jgi:hypothetical protein